MEVERPEPVPPFEQQPTIRDRIETEIERRIQQGLEDRADLLTTPELYERERARLEATIRPTVERSFGQVYIAGEGLTTPPTQGGFIPFFRPSRIAVQPDGTRLYRDPVTNELREPTPGEELFESFAQQQKMTEQEAQQAALMGQAPEEGFGVLQTVEPGYGVYEGPLTAAFRGIGGVASSLAGEFIRGPLTYEVPPEAAAEAERLSSEAWEALQNPDASLSEAYSDYAALQQQSEDALLYAPGVDTSDIGYKLAYARNVLGMRSTFSHPYLPFLEIPLPGQARVQEPRTVYDVDPEGKRRASTVAVPSYFDDRVGFRLAETRRLGQNIASGRSIGDEYRDLPLLSGYYDGAWGDPDAAYWLGLVGEVSLPLGPGTIYRGTAGPISESLRTIAAGAKARGVGRSVAKDVRALGQAVKPLARAAAEVGEGVARQTARTAGVSDELFDAAKISRPYNRARAAAVEAAAATGDYTRAVYRAATGRTDPFVIRKVSERVLRAAGVDDALISQAVRGISRTSTNAAEVFVDIQRGLMGDAVEGGVRPYLVDGETLQRIERGLKLGIPDDYVMITDDIAVPRSISARLREGASRFAQSQLRRDQESKFAYLEKVIKGYEKVVDESIIKALRGYQDRLEDLTDPVQIKKLDELIERQLAFIGNTQRRVMLDDGIPAELAEQAGQRVQSGYRFKPMNEVKQTLSEAMRQGIPVNRTFDELDLQTKQLVIERLKEHFIMRQAGNYARNTMDVGAMQLYLDRSIKGFNNLLDFRALNTPFSRQLVALFGKKLDDTTKFSVDMANLLRRAGRGRTRQIARLVEEKAREITEHITATLEGVKTGRAGSRLKVEAAEDALRKANAAFEKAPNPKNFEAVKAAQDSLARETAKAKDLATRLDESEASARALQQRMDEHGTAVTAIEFLLERMAREGRIGPDQIWEQLFSTMFNPKLNRQILKQALEAAGMQGALARYPTVETINAVARVAQDIPQVRWAGRTTPFTNDAVKHMLAAMMDGPIRDAAARGIITREIQRKINLSPYIKEAIEQQMGITEAVFDPATGAKIAEDSRKLGLIFPVDRPLGASRLTPGVDTEFERVIAAGGGEFLEVLNYVPPKYRPSLAQMAIQAGQYMLQQGQMGIRQAAKYGYFIPNLPFLLYKRLEMPFVAATQVGVSNAMAGEKAMRQYVRNQILRRNTTGGGITTADGVYYSPSDLARLSEQEGIGYTAVEAERVGLALTDMLQDINRRLPEGQRGKIDLANPVTKTFWTRTAEAMERSFRQGVFEARLAAGDTVREAGEVARRSLFDYDEVPQGLRAGILPQIYQGAAVDFKLTSEMALLALKNPSALGKYMRGLETMQNVQDPYGLEGDRSLLNLKLPRSVTMGDDYYIPVPGAGIAARTMIAARHGDNLVNSMKAAREALRANAPGKAIAEVGVVAGIPFVYTLVDSAIGPVLKSFEAFEGADPYPTAGSQRQVSDEKIFWAAMLYAIDRDPTMQDGDWADFQRFYDPIQVEPPPEREHPQIPGAWAERPEGMPYVFAGRTAPSEQHPEGLPIYRAYEMGENGKFNLGVVRGLDPTDIRRFFPTYIAGTVGDVAYGDPQGAGRIERVNAEQFVDETGVQEAMNLFFNPAGIDYSKPEEVRAAQARELLRARTPLQPTP
jgi:hypothetical protein